MITVIILSFALLALVTGSSAAGFAARFAVLEAQAKAMSRSLAEACLNAALVKYVSDASYAGNEDVSVRGETCRIYGLASSGSTMRLTAGAAYKGAQTYLTARFDLADPRHPQTECWQEILSPTDNACDP